MAFYCSFNIPCIIRITYFIHPRPKCSALLQKHVWCFAKPRTKMLSFVTSAGDFSWGMPTDNFHLEKAFLNYRYIIRDVFNSLTPLQISKNHSFLTNDNVLIEKRNATDENEGTLRIWAALKRLYERPLFKTIECLVFTNEIF